MDPNTIPTTPIPPPPLTPLPPLPPTTPLPPPPVSQIPESYEPPPESPTPPRKSRLPLVIILLVIVLAIILSTAIYFLRVAPPRNTTTLPESSSGLLFSPEPTPAFTASPSGSLTGTGPFYFDDFTDILAVDPNFRPLEEEHQTLNHGTVSWNQGQNTADLLGTEWVAHLTLTESEPELIELPSSEYDPLKYGYSPSLDYLNLSWRPLSIDRATGRINGLIREQDGKIQVLLTTLEYQNPQYQESSDGATILRYPVNATYRIFITEPTPVNHIQSPAHPK